MGLFDKIKKSVLQNTENTAPTDTAKEPEAAQPVAAPAEQVEKEDFSALSDLQVLEKIDQYVNELKRTPNPIVYGKMNDAINEFDARFASIPLSKRGAISQYWSFLKVQRDNARMVMANPNSISFVGTMADQIASYVGKIYAELCK